MINRFAQAVAAMTSHRRSTLASRAGRRWVPSLWWLTDSDRMTGDEVAATVTRLPAGTAVVIRHRDTAARRRWVAEIAPICRRRRLKILVADDAETAMAFGSDGFHAPEAAVRAGLPCRLRLWLAARGRILSASGHDARAVCDARRPPARAAAIMVAPVFATDSHPGRRSLGPVRFAALARYAQGRAVALGGIEPRTLNRLRGVRLLGVAGIGFAASAAREI